jgi:hypothetical protein
MRYAVVFLAAVAACSDSSADHHPTADDPLAGTWISDTWRMGLVAKNGRINFYELTDVSCLPYDQIGYEGLDIPAFGAVGHFEGDEIVFELLGSAELRARPVDALPETCANGGTAESDDAQLAFEVYWHTFEELYASFDLHPVDWQAQYDAYRSQVTAETTGDQLFAILCEMSAPFNDPHVDITWGDTGCPTKPLPAWLQDDSAEAMLMAVEDQVYGDGNTVLANGVVSYRWLDDQVGYLFIASMGGSAQDAARDVANIGAALDEVVRAFASASAVIVDLRFNGGGDDAISLTIADRFADQDRLAFSVKTRDGDGWTPMRDYDVTPEGPAQLTQPVLVLTSTYTVSAAETFVMAMQTLPNVTVMGETTCGGHSNAMYRNLPNHLSFTLPFERTYAADGVCYEGIGLVPDVAQAFDYEGYIAGDDSMLAAGRAWLAEH